MGGLLLVDKPEGMTSHDVVGVVRRAARTRRVGHAGTLDPFATGLLVLAVGSATRLLPYLDGEPKVYQATMRFGWETDSDDATGEPSRRAPAPLATVLEDPVAPERVRAEQQLSGPLAQVPPAYSAKHVGGRRAYDLARQGRPAVLAPVPVVIHQWRWLGGSPEALVTEITCSGGTYIRALARDLGRALQSAAHCDELRRLASGPLTVADALPVASLEPGAVAEGRVMLRSPLSALRADAHEELDEEGLRAIRQGRRVVATQPGERAALLFRGEVVAMASRTEDDRWRPRVVLGGEEP